MHFSFRACRIGCAALLTLASLTVTRFAAAESAYVESIGTGGIGQFGLLDLVTGGYQLIGTRTGDLPGSTVSSGFSGLALSSGGVLYGMTAANELYTVNAATGQATIRGSLSLTGQLTSVSFASDGLLYGLLSNGFGAASLVRINNPGVGSGTLSATTIGGFGMLSNGALAGDASGNLYATEGNIAATGFGSLLQVSKSTGTASSLSPDGDAGFNAPVLALSFSANTLFAIDNGTGALGTVADGSIYRVDRATGVATTTANYSSSTAGNIFAASRGFTVPEPGTVALLLPVLGMVAVGNTIVRRRKK